MTNLSEGLYIGDQAALAAAYQKYHDELYHHALKHTNPDVAEDIVGSVFLQLRQYKGRIRHVQSFLHRLVTLGRVRWLREAARNSHEKINEETDLISYQTPGSLACQAEQTQAVTTAIHRLSPGDQAAIQASYYDGLSSEGVSQLLGCTPNAARLRISRAIKKLRLDLHQRRDYT